MANDLDIFGQKAATFGGAFSADDALLTFTKVKDAATGVNLGGEIPLLLQNLAMNYQQAITRLFDLASAKMWLVRGRAAGSCQLGQVIGPSRLSYNFLKQYGNVCAAGSNSLNLTLMSGCTNTEGVPSGQSYNWSQSFGYIMEYPVIESIGIQMAAESMVIQQNLQMQVGVLKYMDEEQSRRSAAGAAA